MKIQSSPTGAFPATEAQEPPRRALSPGQPPIKSIAAFPQAAPSPRRPGIPDPGMAPRVRRDAPSATPAIPGVTGLRVVTAGDGQQHFVGTLPGGEPIVLTTDPLGNLQGASDGHFYFRKAGTPSDAPLVPLAQKAFIRQRDEAYLSRLPGVQSLAFFQSTSLAPPGKTSPENDYYRGSLADGTEVFLHVDPWGNLHGADQKGRYYYQRNLAANPQALQPLSEREYAVKVLDGELEADGDRFTIDHVFRQMANPFHGLGDLLQLAGVDEQTASRVESWANNPVGNVVKEINRTSGNALGRLFGLSERDFEQKALAAGDFTKNFVPMYGQMRFFSDLVRKAVHNEPVTPEEQVSLGAMLKMEARPPMSSARPLEGAAEKAAGRPDEKAAEKPEKPASSKSSEASNAAGDEAGIAGQASKGLREKLTQAPEPNDVLVSRGTDVSPAGERAEAALDRPRRPSAMESAGANQRRESDSGPDATVAEGAAAKVERANKRTRPLPPPASIDESRLVPAGGGLYAGTDGGQYIKMDDQIYMVRKERDTSRWKLVDPAHPDAFGNGGYYVIRENGEWHTVEVFQGYRGGAPELGGKAADASRSPEVGPAGLQDMLTEEYWKKNLSKEDIRDVNSPGYWRNYGNPSDKVPSRTLNEVFDLGSSILNRIKEKGATSKPPLVLYRTMPDAEANAILKWNAKHKANTEAFVAKGRDGRSPQQISRAFNDRQVDTANGPVEIGILPIKGHLGDLAQAKTYYKPGTGQKILAFELKPGAEQIMFDPEFMAILRNGKGVPAYMAKYVQKNGKTFPPAGKGEGNARGYIGIKSESRGSFSVTMSDSDATHLLYQLFVRDVRVVDPAAIQSSP